jgi:hypothetical protein
VERLADTLAYHVRRNEIFARETELVESAIRQ